MSQPSFRFQLQGDLVAQKALELKQQLHHLIEQGHHDLLVDLTAVREVDIAGINALALAYKKMRASEGRMQLRITSNSPLARMLHITKFDLVLPCTIQ